jgi:HCOMODA/2-hydroxy-3-carboxy-muconic semialdehyde decarboxylase
VADTGHVAAQARRLRIGARAIARAGLVHAYGHCSMRIDGERFMVTPPKPLGMIVDGEEAVIVENMGPLPAGALPEVVVHQRIYAQRKDVNGVVRFQSPNLTALSAVGRTPRALHGFGAYFAPQPPLYPNPRLVRDSDSAAALVQLLKNGRGIVMRGNGAVTVGQSFEEAVVMAWYLEDAARVELAVLSTGLQAQEFNSGEAADRAITQGRLIERMWAWLTCHDPEQIREGEGV